MSGVGGGREEGVEEIYKELQMNVDYCMDMKMIQGPLLVCRRLQGIPES